MAIPTNGLVFYAPLAEDKATAETGQTLTKTGTITQAKIDGIPCSYFNGNSYIRVDLSTMPYGTDDFAFSLWARCDGESGVVLQLGSWTTGARLSQLGDGMLQAWLRGTVDLRTTEAYDRMVHVAVTRNSGTSSFYINGSLVATSQETAELSQYTQISLMNSYTNGPRYITGYLAAVRLYNRGLSADEIAELANEFVEESASQEATNILIQLDAARDTLVAAINAKGVSISQDSTLYQCALAVGNIDGDTSAFEADAMAIIGTPTGEGGDIEPISQKYMTVTSTDDVGCGVGIEFTGTIQIVEDGVANLYTTSPISNIALRNATVYGDNITYFNCGSTNLASVDPSHNDQLVTLICSNGYLTALDISNNSLLTTLEANSNNLSSAVVDKILSDLVAHGKSNGLLRLENSAGIGAASNGAPTSQNNVTTLQSRGWTVTTA